jgi:hypothetical protein
MAVSLVFPSSATPDSLYAPETSIERASQESKSSPSARPYGFGFYAAGSCNHDYTLSGGGGGGEGFPWKSLGLGFEAGYYKFHEDTSFGLASFNVAYHLGDPSSGRVDPFLGVSAGFYWAEEQAGAGLGFGGGLNVWFTDRVGVRADLRLQTLGTEEGLFLYRVGVTVR